MNNSKALSSQLTIFGFLAVGFMTLTLVGYKYYLNPYFKRQDRIRNSEFADFVFEQEQKSK